jgi:uncharacterized membrane protein
MPDNQQPRVIREAVGVFNSFEDFQDAVDELLSSGFHRADLSLLTSEHVVTEKLGHRYQKLDTLQDDPKVPRAAYVSPEAMGDAEGAVIGTLMYVGATAAAGAILVSGGTLAVAIAAVALGWGAGGLIGSILAIWIGDHYAHYLQEQMEHGGLLLWVRTWNAEEERRAVKILRKHSGSHVHLHALPAAA